MYTHLFISLYSVELVSLRKLGGRRLKFIQDKLLGSEDFGAGQTCRLQLLIE